MAVGNAAVLFRCGEWKKVGEYGGGVAVGAEECDDVDPGAQRETSPPPK